MNRHFITTITLTAFFAWTFVYGQKSEQHDNSFYLLYEFSGLGSNMGSIEPTIKINGTKLIYTYEQNSSWNGKYTMRPDTILITTIRFSTIDSIKNILNGLKDTTISESNPCIMSGGIHSLTVANGKDTINFEMINTFDWTALKITNILNEYLPADKKIWATEKSTEKLIKEAADCWQSLEKENTKQKTKK